MSNDILNNVSIHALKQRKTRYGIEWSCSIRYNGKLVCKAEDNARNIEMYYDAKDRAQWAQLRQQILDSINNVINLDTLLACCENGQTLAQGFQTYKLIEKMQNATR